MKATFGAGCFWHVEEAFREIEGVTRTTVGYMGGKTKNPTYKDVCSHTTGHAEVCQIEYDSKQTSYDRLLKVFWEIHDPTTINQQGVDIGEQYRSIIFYHNDAQKKAALASKNKEQKKYKEQIVTEITKATEFYKAEDYHQGYLQKRGLKTCFGLFKPRA